MYDSLELSFWLKLGLLLLFVSLAILLFDLVMRKWLKMDKKKWFSRNYVNEQHNKIDVTVRILFAGMMILGYAINNARDFADRIWFIEPWFFIAGLVIVSEAFRAFMEWKYAPNRNAYILTISQLAFAVVLVFSVIKVNFFNML